MSGFNGAINNGNVKKTDIIINELQAMSASDLTANDALPVWDAEASGTDRTKKITAQNLATGLAKTKNWSLVNGSLVDISGYLSFNNAFTAPSDGYLYMWTKTANCYIGGSSVRAGGGSMYVTVFIKKGLTLYLSDAIGSNEIARFYSIQ